MNEKHTVIALKDIAAATGQNIQVVRKHARSGFDVDDLVSVSRYIVGRRLVSGLEALEIAAWNGMIQAPAPPAPPAPAVAPAPIFEPEKISKPIVVEGEVNDAMAAFLAKAPGVPEMGVSEESEWDIGNRKWMELARRVELDGDLDDDTEWGEYNAGKVKYGSGKRR